jgi:hypothetical protein
MQSLAHLGASYSASSSKSKSSACAVRWRLVALLGCFAVSTWPDRLLPGAAAELLRCCFFPAFEALPLRLARAAGMLEYCAAPACQLDSTRLADHKWLLFMHCALHADGSRRTMITSSKGYGMNLAEAHIKGCALRAGLLTTAGYTQVKLAAGNAPGFPSVPRRPCPRSPLRG